MSLYQEELPEDSDSSDEDYVPEGKPQEVVSEVDSDGDPEDPLSESENPDKRGKKRTKTLTKSRKKQKNDIAHIEEPEEKKEATEEVKKKADDFWADFVKDTGFKSKETIKKEIVQPKTSTETTNSKESPKTLPTPPTKAAEKVKVTEIFEFAGEEVRVEKEVDANSAEARLLAKPSSTNSNSSIGGPPKRGGLGGIGSVLSQLGKKKKLGTLEKTKLDWDRFKKDENLEEELKTHNKGKDGFLERQDFLQRADLRRFEIEKELRTIERNKRLSNCGGGQNI